VFRRRLLPWDYGVRNLFRRPTQSLLTLSALATVVFLLLVIVGFVRGLEVSLAASGDPQVMTVYALGASEGMENSAIPARTPGLLSASLGCIRKRFGAEYVSPELYVGTRVAAGSGDRSLLGVVRGVTPAAALVRSPVRIVEGRWPGPGEILAGRLAATKLGCRDEDLAIGQTVRFEGREWRVSGRFEAGGTAFDSELWCPLADLQQATRRQDLSLVALALAPGASPAEVGLFCKERVDLELQAEREVEYYAALTRHFRPIRIMAWVVVCLVAGAGVFAGLNTMYGAVAGRVRELATLQAIGFRRCAILAAVVQEASLLAVTGSLIAACLALAWAHGAAVRFSMGAFTLRIDSLSLLVGLGGGFLLGLFGAVPPALRAMRLPVAESLKAV